MKSKMFGNVALWLALCGTLLELAACSEKSTAGATVDDNSVAEISADEKLILEHQVDSVKNFVDGIPADIDDYERDTTRFWFEIRFSGEHENFFAYENKDPYSYCFVNIYQSDFGMRTIEYLPIGDSYTRTFFLTADEQGLVYHEKLDNHDSMSVTTLKRTNINKCIINLTLERYEKQSFEKFWIMRFASVLCCMSANECFSSSDRVNRH